MMEITSFCLTSVLLVGATVQGELRATWGPHGELTSLLMDGQLVASRGEIALAQPGWKGLATQSAAREVALTEEAEVRTVQGRLVAGPIAVRFTQTIRASPDRLELTYEILPEREFPVAAVLYRLLVPVEVARDGKWRVADRGKEFPAELPPNYVLAASPAEVAGWAKGAAGLGIRLLGGPVRVQLQDDRKFNYEAFEFQLYAHAPRLLRPGDRVRLHFALEPATAEEMVPPPPPPPTQPPLCDDRPLQLGGVVPDRTQVPRYGKIEFVLDLAATYTNAFDPEEIDVEGHFATPSGQTLTVPAFFWRDYTRQRRAGREVLVPRGEPGWRLRFAPTEVGRYTLTVTARDRTGKTVTSAPVAFTCIPSADPGYVRVSRDDPRYFAFDEGTPYLPLGANVCWARGGGTFDYDQWLPRYGEAGGNYFRVWLGPAWTTFALETTGEPADRYGVGKFNLANAWRLDYVLDLAERYGLYVMLCLDSFNELRRAQDGVYSFWEQTPHNAANGGPLREPEEFWTNETMRRLYRNKLRYLVARYGYRTHVLSWEFWNEVDIVSPRAYRPEAVRDWHAQMSDYLRRIDPWKHLQTTSFAGSGGKPEIDRLPQMDYVQTHCYGPRDLAAALATWQQRKAKYGKPHYVGEFGTSARGGEERIDPTGIGLHNGLWGSLLSGAAGGAMLWWWDNHIHPNDLYYHFAALHRFLAGVDFPREQFRPLEEPQFAFAAPLPKPLYTDLHFANGPVSWQPSPANRPTRVTLTRDGEVRVEEQVAGILHGLVNHPDLHNPLTLEVDLPRACEFTVWVNGVSGYGGAHLVVMLDGETVLERDLPDPDGDERHDTLRQYDGPYTVTVPAGRHRVKVENVGKDWVFVAYILKGAVRQRKPHLRAFGLQNDRRALVWVQHPGHTWHRVAVLKQEPTPQPPSVLTLRGFREGEYTVEIWDTYQGEVTARQTVRVAGGQLSVALPAIATDVAVRVEPGEG